MFRVWLEFRVLGNPFCPFFILGSSFFFFRKVTVIRKFYHVVYTLYVGNLFGALEQQPSSLGGYLEVHCTYNLLSNCSYNLNKSPSHNYSYPRYNWVITAVTK